MSIGRILSGLASAPLRQSRRLDNISSYEIGKAESAQTWYDLGLELEDDELVVVSLDGTPGGLSFAPFSSPSLTKR